MYVKMLKKTENEKRRFCKVIVISGILIEGDRAP